MISMAVKIYSTTWCSFCRMAKEFFKDNKIKFEDINVQEDQKAAEEMIKKTGQSGVPVIDIDGKIIIGFNIEEIKKVLKLV